LQKYCTPKWNGMKLLLLLATLISLAPAGCATKLAANTVPSCVQQQIEAIKKSAKWNPPAAVDEYSYNGKTVYLFSADCCDQYNTVYDGECNVVCAPSGGLTGKGDGRCNGFFEVAKHVRLVWKDER